MGEEEELGLALKHVANLIGEDDGGDSDGMKAIGSQVQSFAKNEKL